MEIHKIKAGVELYLTSEDLEKPRELLGLLESLLNDGERRIVANLEGVPQLFSFHIGTLVTLHLTCYENLAVFSLKNLSEKNRLVLKLVGLDKVMALHQGDRVVEESFGFPDDEDLVPLN
jgi:anti-anti-sigma regulatory factor